jgi:hypothetical protein
MPRTRLLLAILLLLSALPARADVSVTGARDAVRIEVDNAAIEDVMDALGANFALRYRTTAPLGRRITGTHRGVLERVVARILDGYDFVIRTGPEGIEVTVYGAVKPEDAQQQTRSFNAAAPVATTPSAARTRREERRRRE